MNIAIFAPHHNPYSETFIQAHKNLLDGKICYYYGTDRIKLEGDNIAHKKPDSLWVRVKRKIGLKIKTTTNKQDVLASLKDNSIDVALIEYGLHAHRLLPLLKESELPFVVHFHGYDASMHEVLERTQQYKEVFDVAKAVVAVSKVMERMLLKMGCPKKKLYHNVYGPRQEFLKVEPQFSSLQFIGVGRFTNKKAPYYTILAFSQAAKQFPEARLVLAGDGMLMNSCMNLVKYLDLEKQVCFPGVITEKEFRKELQNSLAYVQHSIRAEDGDMEGTPLSILEASAAGLPVISTRHAGIPDVVIDGETGLLCEEHDVVAMSTNMIKLLEDRELAKRLGSKGKVHIQNNLSLKRHIEELNNILKQAVL